MAGSILENTVIATSGRVINSVLGVVGIALISRYLGVSGFGIYSLVIAYGAIVQVTTDGGLYLTLSRRISQEPNKEGVYLRHITTMRLLTLAVGISVGIFCTQLIPSLQGITSLYMLAAIGFAAQSLSQLMMGVFQKHASVWRAVVGDTIGRILQLCGLVAIGSTQLTLFAAIGLFSAGATMSLLVHRALTPSSHSMKPVFNWGIWRPIIIESWPLAALLILNTIYFRIDTIMLSMFRGPEDVGVYSVAYRIIESGLFFPAMFGGLLLPRISSSLSKNDINQAAQQFNQSLVLMLWAAVAVVILTQFASTEIIHLIAGTEFKQASPLLSILGLALACMTIGNIGGFALVALGRQKSMLALAGVLAVGNTIANYIFIPRFGASAAALTTVATELCALAVAMLIISRQLSLHISSAYLFRLAAVGACTATAAALLPHTLTLAGSAVRVVSVIGLYIAWTTLIKPFRLKDIQALTTRSHGFN